MRPQCSLKNIHLSSIDLPHLDGGLKEGVSPDVQRQIEVCQWQ